VSLTEYPARIALLEILQHAGLSSGHAHRQRSLPQSSSASRLTASRYELRIQAKKVRYASEFFAGIFPGKKASKRREKFLSALKSVQDCLGDLNDIAVHEDRITAIANESRRSRRLRGNPKCAFAAGLLTGGEDAAWTPFCNVCQRRPCGLDHDRAVLVLGSRSWHSQALAECLVRTSQSNLWRFRRTAFRFVSTNLEGFIFWQSSRCFRRAPAAA
jgi:hypothetical protein